MARRTLKPGIAWSVAAVSPGHCGKGADSGKATWSKGSRVLSLGAAQRRKARPAGPRDKETQHDRARFDCFGYAQHKSAQHRRWSAMRAVGDQNRRNQTQLIQGIIQSQMLRPA